MAKLGGVGESLKLCRCVHVCVGVLPSVTLLSGSVKDLDVFQLYTDASPELD